MVAGWLFDDGHAGLEGSLTEAGEDFEGWGKFAAVAADMYVSMP